ncbi:uncharacterized protein LOC112349639 [Selaginella moellendorffii]|uniref:uncharacterized protein LOC112349639 n=1 Tax=Selaginella moellendorffii TaxID=88036 RepID=UPI000D1C90FE|nr:uncharacterized protein LOC112349639 [Selaginella moellendorffii]|eukprot:XP_024540164.1 uncharacterized protein LOC112349639 [Selaginella moellendorffii]
MEVISPSKKPELREEESQEHRLRKFLGEIHCLENANKLLKEISPVINQSVFARILRNFNSAIMCSPQGETCSELLQILDRLEDQVFVEAEEALRQDDTRMSCNSCESSDRAQGMLLGRRARTNAFSVFDHRHPPSPVSMISSTLRSPLPSSSPDFHSAVASSDERSSHHDDPRDLDALRSVRFRRTVRRLENTFVECSSPSTESAGSVFGKFDFFNAHRKVSRRNSGSKKNSSGNGSRSAESFDVFQGSSTSSTTTAGKDTKKELEFFQRQRFTARAASFIPEVACRSLVLVSSKASRHRLLPEQAFAIKQQRSSSIMPAKFVKGSLQCLAKDGDISYNLWLDDTEELIVAKTASQDISEDQELCDQVFVFSSYKCKGKERSGWRQWGKKDKPAVEVLGKMKIFSTVIPEMDRGGRNRHYLDSDFVLFEARGKDQVAMSSPRQQLAVSSSRRLSFSSWDATPSESPGCVTSSSSESPRVAEKSGTPGKHWSSVGFLKHNRKEGSKLGDSFSFRGSETGGSFSSRTSFVEVAAVVTRVPIGVKKRSNSTNSQLSSWESRLKRNNPLGLVEETYEKMSLTVVLPAGEHGCPAYGLPGPLPLLERWRGGGKCDCGSWDLGCGLVLLQNQQTLRCSAKAAQEQSSGINVVLQAKKHEVALRLSPLYDDDTFSVSFQQPLSTLQAFGTAVALLHSRKKPLKLGRSKDENESNKGAVEVAKNSSKKNFVPRLLLRGSSFQEAMTLTGLPKIRRVYSLGCRPEPSSLVERV